MTTYVGRKIGLTEGQKTKLRKAYQTRAPVSLRLKHAQLSGGDQVFLTQRQLARLEKAKRAGTGAQIDISQAQIREKRGGALGPLGALLPALAKIDATALPWVAKAAAPLATGALSALASLGVKAGLGKKTGSGLFSVPQVKVDRLIAYKHLLTKAQKEQIVRELATGGGQGVHIQLTRAQQGGFLGTLLASIGVPLLLNALTGKGGGRGLQVGPGALTNVRNVYVPTGKGRRTSTKKTGAGLLLGKNSPFKGIPPLGDIL